MKLLFVTSNRVGDAVLSTGVLGALIDRYPGAEVTVACGPYAADLFRAVPGLKDIIVLRKKSFNRHWIKFWQATVATRWDLVVDLRNSLAARLLLARQRAHGTKRLNSQEHKIVENARILSLDPPPAPRLWLDAAAEQNAAALLPTEGALLALGPAANWAPKQWPIERFTQLAEMLTLETGPFPNASVLVIASEGERSAVTPLLKALGTRALPIIGYDLLTVGACLKRCHLFVGNDSGLMHMASAAGVPTLGLFGPGLEEVYGPWGGHAAYIRTPESREELLSRLPFCRNPDASLMTGLTVGKVYEKACGLIGKIP